MSARVTYWTGTWDPEKEAISKEIQLLRSLGGGDRPVVSFAPGQRTSIDLRGRVLRLSGRRWLALRALAPAVEATGTVNHIFGGLNSSWHLLRSVGRRPTILTVVIPGSPSDLRLCAHVDCFVAEDEPMRQMLIASGIPSTRVRLIYPGIDLHAYRPAGQVISRPFRILFASSPADPAELEVRGVPLLVETARLCPEMEFVLLWRKWGNETAAREALQRLRLPDNVKVEYLDGRDMPTAYRSAHAIACLYAPGFGKSCPNSVVEGLACGLPALVSDSSGVAPLLTQHNAGLTAARNPRDVAQAARQLRDLHRGFSQSARELAEQVFDVRRFLESYLQLYRAVSEHTAEAEFVAARHSSDSSRA